MHILPSRGRPKDLTRFFALSDPQESGILLLDDDDAHNYVDVPIPSHWQTIVGPRDSIVNLANRTFERFPDEDWYSFLADDLICGPQGWDSTLARLCGKDRLSWANDLINGPDNCCFPFIGGDLVRKMGWMFHPGFGHLYVDTIWHHLQRDLNFGVYAPDITMEHLHWSTGKHARDQTAAERRIHGDSERYASLMHDGYQALKERLHADRNRITGAA